MALGTVQFGLDYGISNQTGQVSPETVADILEHAASIGLATLDTASAYGNSEEVLGTILTTNTFDFDLISKFPRETTAESLEDSLEQSLSKLGVFSLKAYLAHDFESFKKPGIRESLQRAKADGKVEKIGVSVYYPGELEWLLERNISFDIIQCPFNLFDGRFKTIFPNLKKRGVEIHTRSSFLQGLFFMNPNELSDYFRDVKDNITTLQALSKVREIPLEALLLNYCILQNDIDKVVFGVQTLQEFKQNLAAFAHVASCQTFVAELEDFAITNEAILHPGRWPKTKS